MVPRESRGDRAAYTDTTLWADDVWAVMDAAGLDRPVLVGWCLRLARHRLLSGEFRRGPGGRFVALAGGIPRHRRGPRKLDGRSRKPRPRPRSLHRRCAAPCCGPRRASSRPARRNRSTARPMRGLSGANMLCPAHVRRALFRRPPWISGPSTRPFSRPGLVIHGTGDRVVSPATGGGRGPAHEAGTLSAL